jgi:hypothetical protein
MPAVQAAFERLTLRTVDGTSSSAATRLGLAGRAEEHWKHSMRLGTCRASTLRHAACGGLQRLTTCHWACQGARTLYLAKLTTEHMSQTQSNAAAGFAGAGPAALVSLR